MKLLTRIANALLLLIVFGYSAFGQSAHQEQYEYYNSLGKDGDYYQENYEPVLAPVYNKANCTPDKVVFGWHPYWSNGKEVNYQWDLITDLSYFSYDLNPATGGPTTTNNFQTANVVTEALNQGKDVSLCVTLFSNHNTFFNSPTAQQNFITTIIDLIQARGVTGINLDFESMSASHKEPYKNFVIDLSTQFKAAIPNGKLSMALAAVEWSDVYDVVAMEPYVDLFCIMGYDYYYGGSANAGPTDPLYHFGNTYDFTLSKSTTHYVNKGIPLEKLVLALPYYGRAWDVQNYNIPASTTSGGNSPSAITYEAMRNNSDFSASNRHHDDYTRSTYYNYTLNGNSRQLFITEEADMRERLDFVRKRGLAGMGMWALGFDDGYPEFWNAINDYMTDCYEDPCEGTIYDMGGGPNRPYYHNEDYTITVAPPNASSIDVSFGAFNVEANYDYLYVYDGNSTSAPQVPGSPFSGTTIPSSFTTSSGAFTFRFTSDGATAAPGYELNYSCNYIYDDPITYIEAPGAWIITDFEQNFDDSAPNSELKKAFFNLADYDGINWRSNSDNGFYKDYFNGSEIHEDWSIENGAWSVNNTFIQTDETDGNTNAYTALNQSLSNTYLYSWDAKISGAGTNKRAGIHIFSDDASQENRGNSYLIYFRPDAGNVPPNNEIQIYKVEDDVLTLEVNAPFTINSDEWYNYKVVYDRITGEFHIYIDDSLAVTWLDNNPLLEGDFISFRTGNCAYEIDNLEVYRSRYPSVEIKVGEGTDNDFRYQNPSPTQPAGMISSLVSNEALRLSEKDSVLVNIDWSAPEFDFVHDGDLSTDLDTIYTSFLSASAFWSADDLNSGISSYEYAIGTEPAGTSIVDWTIILGGESVTSSSPNLEYDEFYYFTIRAINGAGLVKEQASDGFRLLEPSTVGVDLKELIDVVVYPNPTRNVLNIETQTKIDEVNIYDSKGKKINSRIVYGNTTQMDVSNLPQGSYFVELEVNGELVRIQWIKL